MLPAVVSSALFGDDEDQVLNCIWIGLVGVEAAMVIGLAVQTLLRCLRPRFKQDLQRASSFSP